METAGKSCETNRGIKKSGMVPPSHTEAILAHASPRDLVLYLARHECGAKISRGKGIEFACRFLGHADIAATQRYMHPHDQELADTQDLVE